jgi:hypothetical protein
MRIHRIELWFDIVIMGLIVSCSSMRDYSVEKISRNKFIYRLSYKFSFDTLNNCILLIDNGVPILNDELIVLKSNSLVWPSVLNRDQFPHAKCNFVVMIVDDYKQDVKDKEVLFNKLKYSLEVKTLWTSHYLTSDAWKVILINGVPYFPKEIQKFILGLSINSIEYIHETDIPLNETIYGSLSSNGLVEIKLKKGVKVKIFK